MKVNKKEILEEVFAKVYQTAKQSPIPDFILNNYHRPETLKPELQNNNLAISQDFTNRLGANILSKLTIGAGTYAGIGALQHHLGMDPNDASTKAMQIIPTIGASWIGSNIIQNKIPDIHKAIYKEKSIYK